jgi:hypothetical protein
MASDPRLTREEIPAGLEQLRPYLEKEKLPWEELSVGDSVVVTSCNATGEALGECEFTLLAMEQEREGTYRTVLRLERAEVTFGDDASPRQPVELPPGTIMAGGVSCQHFPETNAYMTYVGGISTGRDFSFDHVRTPDGAVRQDVALQGVAKVAHRAGEIAASDEEAVAEYRQAVEEALEQAGAEQAQQMREIEEQFDKDLAEHLDEETIAGIKGLWSTFCDEGKWRLAILWFHAMEQEKTDRYLPALKEAMEKEFTWSPPSARGAMMLPASPRGYDMMIAHLGLERRDS